jgi:hypothetical protein
MLVICAGQRSSFKHIVCLALGRGREPQHAPSGVIDRVHGDGDGDGQI